MPSGISDSDTSSAERNERRLQEAKGEEGDVEYSPGSRSVARISLEYQKMVNLDYFHDLTGDHETTEYDNSKSAEFRRSLVDEVKRFGKIYVEPPSKLKNPIHLQNYNTRKIQKQRAKLAYKWKITDIPYEESDPESDRCQTPESEPSSWEDPPQHKCLKSDDEKKTTPKRTCKSQQHNPRFQSSTPASDVTSVTTPVKSTANSFPKRTQSDENPSPSPAHRSPNAQSIYQGQRWSPERNWPPYAQHQWSSPPRVESPPIPQQVGATKDWTNIAATHMRSHIPEVFESSPQDFLSPPLTYPAQSTLVDTECSFDHPMRAQLSLLKRAIKKIRERKNVVPEELKQLQNELLNCHWCPDPSGDVKKSTDIGSDTLEVETPIRVHPNSFPPRHPYSGTSQEEKRYEHIQFTPKLFSDDNSTKSIESTKFMVYLSEQQDHLDSGESDYFLSRVKVS